MTISKRMSRYLMIAVILTTSAAAAQSPNSGQLDGAWNVTIVFDQPGLPPCAPAPAVAIATSATRGTMIAESCYASEGAGHGAWARTGNNQFSITFVGNSFAPDGTVAASYKVRATVSLGPTGDTFAGPFQTQILDLTGNVLDTFTGVVKGVRIVVEP